MVLSPKALKTIWPVMPHDFHTMYIEGNFGHMTAVYQGVATVTAEVQEESSFKNVNIPRNLDQAWEYIQQLCRDYGHRTAWAMSRPTRVFSINFGVLAAVSYLEIDKNWFTWPTTFAGAVELSKMRFRLLLLHKQPARIGNPSTGTHIVSDAWLVKDVDTHRQWVIPQVCLKTSEQL